MSRPEQTGEEHRACRRRPSRRRTRVCYRMPGTDVGPNSTPLVLNLSQSGVGLTLPEPLEVGQELELILEGPGHALQRLARVVWSSPAGDGTYRIGAKFVPKLGYYDLIALAHF